MKLAECPNCKTRHRVLPVSCILNPKKCSPKDMAEYLKNAGFLEEFNTMIDGLVDALIDAGGTKV